MYQKRGMMRWPMVLALMTVFLISSIPATAFGAGEGLAGEQLYKKLSETANRGDDGDLFGRMNAEGRALPWESAREETFVANLRILKPKGAQDDSGSENIYLLRKLNGEVLVLATPENPALLNKGAASDYAGIKEMFEVKMDFKAAVLEGTVDGSMYPFARLAAPPEPLLLDRVFKICIVLMLFFVMVGMGMTLTLNDFALVFKKPKGIIIGQILQFGVMPLLAFALGHLMGFYDDYPFIFVGMILITAIPGGVTSNLMTYYAKGDLALSISLTSFSTVLSIFFTPFLLAVYCSNLPEINVPVKIVVQTILVLVIIPLFIGMTFRAKWPSKAKKMVPFFSALGIVALLALILAGIFGNLNVFADVDRYGVKFYATVFALTFLGMMFGIAGAKLLLINNYQTRAISLETGLRNAALAMTIAILIQDAMGDFYSSMLVTSGLFGLVMYLAGIVSIVLYKPLLPLDMETADIETSPEALSGQTVP